jgi:hypothetical protein
MADLSNIFIPDGSAIRRRIEDPVPFTQNCSNDAFGTGLMAGAGLRTQSGKAAGSEIRYETFENEDIKPKESLIYELQDEVDNCVKKTGDVISGPLQLLNAPHAKFDAVNKEYVDWVMTNLEDKIDSKVSKSSDIDMNHFKIKNVQTPTHVGDAVNKNYVDDKFEHLCHMARQTHFLQSRGHVITQNNPKGVIKKTFFFNPGFICPQRINVTSVAFSTSANKYQIWPESTTWREMATTTKVYFMINNEIRSEYLVEKDTRVGYVLVEFEQPIVIDKGDSFMLVAETPIEDASVNIAFY